MSSSFHPIFIREKFMGSSPRVPLQNKRWEMAFFAGLSCSFLRSTECHLRSFFGPLFHLTLYPFKISYGLFDSRFHSLFLNCFYNRPWTLQTLQTGTLETAIRATNAQYDNPEILKRIDARLLQVCHVNVVMMEVFVIPIFIIVIIRWQTARQGKSIFRALQ